MGMRCVGRQRGGWEVPATEGGQEYKDVDRQGRRPLRMHTCCGVWGGDPLLGMVVQSMTTCVVLLLALQLAVGVIVTHDLWHGLG